MPFVLDASLRLSQQIQGLAAIKQQLAGLGQNIPLNFSVQGGNALNAASAGAKNLAATASQASSAVTQLGANQGFAQVAKNATQGTRAAKDFGDSILLAGKRYAGFLISAGVGFAAVNQLRQGTRAVVEFEQAITRLDQILDAPADKLAMLRKRLLDLSTTTGTGASELSNVATTLAQAGFSPTEVSQSLEPLARVPLLPSFESAQQATEGLIAVLKQFKLEASDSGRIIDELNEIANKFAVTSQDVFEGVKRGGSSFAALGSTFEEFTALFTAVRQTTQESAETVGTALKNIAARLAVPSSVEALKNLGIEVENTEGKFIGILNVVKQLSGLFGELESRGDVLGQVEIAKAVGGDIRQIGRFLAAVRNFDVVEEALRVQRGAAGSAERDAEKALATVGKQFDILKAQVEAFFQAVAPTTIIPFLQGLTELGKTAVVVATQLQPLIPIVTALGGALAIRAGVGLAGSLLGKIGGAAGVGLAAGGLRGAGQSNLGQLAIVAGFSLLGDELKKLATVSAASSKELVNFSGNLLKTGALIVGIGSVARGLSASEFLRTGGLGTPKQPPVNTAARGFIPGVHNAPVSFGLASRVAAPALLASSVIAFAARASVEEAVSEQLSAASKAISDIKVNFGPSDIQKVTEATGELLKNALAGASTQALRFTGPLGNLAGVADRIGDLFSGDIERAFRLDNSTVEEARGTFRNLIKNNIKALEVLVQNAAQTAASSGGQLSTRNALVNNLAETQGLSQSQASVIADQIQRVLGNAAFQAQAKIGLESFDAEATAREVTRITGEFSKLFIPPTITAELFALSDAVKQTTARIFASNAAVQGQIDTLGQARVPGFEQFSRENVRQALVTNPQAFGDIGESFPAVGQAVDALATIETSISKFLNFLAINEEAANRAEATGVPTNRPSDLSQADFFIDKFLQSAGLDKLPGEITGQLRQIFREAAQAFESQAKGTGSVVVPQEQVSELTRQFTPALERIVDVLIDLLTSRLNAFVTNQNQQLQLQTLKLSAQASQGATDQGRSSQQNAALRRAGLIPTAPTPAHTVDVNGAQLGFDAQGSPIAGVGFSEMIEAAARKIPEFTNRLDEADKALRAFSAGATEGQSFTEVFENARAARESMLLLKDGVGALGGSIEDAIRSIDTRQRIEAEAIQRNIADPDRRQAALAASKAGAESDKDALSATLERFRGLQQVFIDSLADVARRNSTDTLPETIFDRAVSDFARSVGEFGQLVAVRPLTATEALRQPTPNLRDVTSQVTGARAEIPVSVRPDVERASLGGLRTGEVNALIKQALREGVNPDFGTLGNIIGGITGKQAVPGGSTLDQLNTAGASLVAEQVARQIVGQQIGRGEVTEENRVAATRELTGRIGELIGAMNADRAGASFGGIDRVTLPEPARAIIQSMPQQLPQVQPTTQPQTDASGRIEETLNAMGRAIEGLAQNLGIQAEGRAGAGGAPDRSGFDAMARAADSVRESATETASGNKELASAIAKGIGVKVDAIQRLNVNVEGLGDSVAAEVKPQFEAAARAVATDVVRKALTDIAGRMDSESANAFLNAAASLG